MADKQIEVNENKAGLLVLLDPDNKWDNDSNFLLIAGGNEQVAPRKYIDVCYSRLMELREDPLEEDETMEDLIEETLTFFVDRYDMEIVSRKRIKQSNGKVNLNKPITGYVSLFVDCPGETPRIQNIRSRVYNLYVDSSE